MKKYKKLLLECNRALEKVSQERDRLASQEAGRGGKSEERERKQREEREAMEDKIEEQARQLKELKDLVKKRSLESYDEEDARVSFPSPDFDFASLTPERQAEIFRLRAELDEEREAREELLGDQEDLRRELRQTQESLEDAEDELARVKQGGRDDSVVSSRLSESGRGVNQLRRQTEKMEKRVVELEQVCTPL